MRFFVWLDFQYEMIALFLGAVSLIAVYLAWASYPGRRIARTEQEHESGHHPEKPLGPFLILTYLIIVSCSIGYLIYVWASGSRF
jgi:hypothetical protein